MIPPKNFGVGAKTNAYHPRHYLHDPEVYPEPNVFNPDRLIASEGKPAQRDPYGQNFR